MAKKLSAEYVSLNAFFEAYVSLVVPADYLPKEKHPLSLLRELEQSAPTKALTELRVAVNDAMEDSAHWPPAKIAVLDAVLGSQHLPSLSQMRQRYWSKYKSVLKRGRIRNEVEYYLVNGILVDQGIEIDTAERAKLEAMTSAYEQAVL